MKHLTKTITLFALLLSGVGHASEAYQRTHAPGYWTGLNGRILYVAPDLRVSVCTAAKDAGSPEIYLICEDRVLNESDGWRYTYRVAKDRMDLVSPADTTCSRLILAAAGLGFYLRVQDPNPDLLRYRHVRDFRTLERWRPPTNLRRIERLKN